MSKFMDFDFALRVANGAAHHDMLNVFAFLHAEFSHPALNAFRVTEQPHEFIV
jgi:hypothetical protein